MPLYLTLTLRTEAILKMEKIGPERLAEAKVLTGVRLRIRVRLEVRIRLKLRPRLRT